MELPYNNLEETPRNRRLVIGVIVGIIVLLHIVLMSVIVANLVAIAPEVNRTLNDVNHMMPQMQRTLFDLGKMLPEIKQGLHVMRQLCDASPNCSYS